MLDFCKLILNNEYNSIVFYLFWGFSKIYVLKCHLIILILRGCIIFTRLLSGCIIFTWSDLGMNDFY